MFDLTQLINQFQEDLQAYPDYQGKKEEGQRCYIVFVEDEIPDWFEIDIDGDKIEGYVWAKL